MMIKQTKAFTLIELMLVIIVFVVIAGIAVPNFRQVYSSMQLKKSANDVAYLMRYAQSRAILKNLKIRLTFDEELKKYWLVQNSSSEEYERFKSRTGRAQEIPSQITVDTDELFITFYPDGSIEKKRLYFCRNEKCYTISTQEQRGYINVFEGKVQ